MRVGMVCYASVGGSGVVATELAKALADRGHDVHLISSEPPFRWQGGVARLHFHRVTVPSYPLFREPQYLLALATTIAHISDEQRLDIVHAHYAVPHATAAYLAQQMLTSADRPGCPRTVTTLHGTDITLVGSDRSYAWAVGFSIERSDIVTAVSQSLKESTVSSLGVHRRIDVIPNFLDCSQYERRFDENLRATLAPGGTGAIIVHMSNFRPVKRVGVVVDVFRLIRREVPARLLLIGDGPDRPEVERQVEDYGLAGDVVFTGEERDPLRWLSVADLFLLPSAQESFGLAALEALACEVPVISSNVGGLPEIIRNDVTGYATMPDAVDEMAVRALELIRDPERRRAMGRAGAEMVRTHYCVERIVPLYEAAYERAMT
ncbi:MAG TPA: N-acetyl-alpha-D-glucosaminyl L-malate synthase BshA [Vicinamibacterales bacterium]|nr:N-acetyl-alpha-D-glucosaminyl L-malate synthase BshA [Vicinamibacterales bacterium]